MEDWQVRHPDQGAIPDSPTLPMTHPLHPYVTHVAYNRRLPSPRSGTPTPRSRLLGHTTRAPVAGSLYSHLREAEASARRKNPRKNGDPSHATDRIQMALKAPYSLETARSVKTRRANLVDISRRVTARKQLGRTSAYAFNDSEANRRSTETVNDRPEGTSWLEDEDSDDATHPQIRMAATRINPTQLPALKSDSSLSDLISQVTLQDEAERTSGLLLVSTSVMQDSDRWKYWMLQDQYRHYRYRQEGKKAMVILPMVNEAFQQLDSVTESKQRLEERNAEITAGEEKVCDELTLVTASKQQLEDGNAKLSAKLEEMIVVIEQLRATVRAQEEELIDLYSDGEVVTKDLVYLDEEIDHLEVNKAKIQEERDRFEAENKVLRQKLSMMDQTETVQAKRSKTFDSQTKAKDEEAEPPKTIPQRIAYSDANRRDRGTTGQARKVNRRYLGRRAQYGPEDKKYEEGAERVARAPQPEGPRD